MREFAEIGFDYNDFLVGDEFFGGVEESEDIIVFGVVGEEFEGFGFDNVGEFVKHVGDLLWGFCCAFHF